MLLEKNTVLLSAATVAGPKECRGPLSSSFDRCCPDLMLGESSFEKAECHMLEESCYLALGKAKLAPEEVDYFIAGDLLNQIVSASFCARKLALPYFGIYGGCSSLTESMILGAVLVEGGFANRVLVATSSHNCTAERQYRFPTEYGYQRPGYAQWTVTGAGAAVLSQSGYGPMIESVTVGKVVDGGETDAFNLGTAMAPAAADTIIRHLDDLNRDPSYYNLILTGDLGGTGKKLNEDLLEKEGKNIRPCYADCGMMLYHPQQQVDAGGSGCATSALVFLGHFYRQMLNNELRKVLLVATGALHSPTLVQQGESIPAIAHAVSLEI